MGLELAEITMDVEDAFDIELADSAAHRSMTVGDFHRLIVDCLARDQRLIEPSPCPEPQGDGYTDARLWTPDQVWAVLREIIHSVAPVSLHEITPDARLAEDLGLG